MLPNLCHSNSASQPPPLNTSNTPLFFSIMSPFLSLKRLSINSKLSRRSSSHSSQSARDSIQGHPSPMDITYAVAFSPSTTPSYPTFEGTPAVGSYAEMLDDDNMSWGTRSSGRQQRYFF